jgi:hypothetical protein
MAHNSDAVVQGLDNQSKLLHDKLSALVQGSINQSRMLNDKLTELVREVSNQANLLTKLSETVTAMAAAQRSALVAQRQQADALNGLATALRDLTDSKKPAATALPSGMGVNKSAHQGA